VQGDHTAGFSIRTSDSGDAERSSHAADARFRAVPGSLYVVATPVGNLRDVTLRALDVLGTADAVAAEDTRVTAGLLRHYGIATRVLSLHEHNEAARAVELVAMLAAGRSVALVSDAGTPAVSDPGARLVRAVRDAGFPVVPIPGANAAVAAISAAGLVSERFVFIGFLPAAVKAQRELLASVAQLPAALVLYEAPHRVRATVELLGEVLGGDRTLVIAREMTKKFEALARMTLAEGEGWFAADPNHARGEFVLLVDAPVPGESAPDGATVDARRLLAALVLELPPARAARVAAAATGLPRDLLYAQAIEIKGEGR
jgi:16S rRNA (cytidine1402-2'-O)-methyltransferase